LLYNGNHGKTKRGDEVKNLDEMTLEQVSEWLRSRMTSDMMRSMETIDLGGLEAILDHWQKMAAHELAARAKR